MLRVHLGDTANPRNDTGHGKVTPSDCSPQPRHLTLSDARRTHHAVIAGQDDEAAYLLADLAALAAHANDFPIHYASLGCRPTELIEDLVRLDHTDTDPDSVLTACRSLAASHPHSGHRLVILDRAADLFLDRGRAWRDVIRTASAHETSFLVLIASLADLAFGGVPLKYQLLNRNVIHLASGHETDASDARLHMNGADVRRIPTGHAHHYAYAHLDGGLVDLLRIRDRPSASAPALHAVTTD